MPTLQLGRALHVPKMDANTLRNPRQLVSENKILNLERKPALLMPALPQLLLLLLLLLRQDQQMQ